MADISKIRLETGTYDVKDEIARNNINLLNCYKPYYDEITYSYSRIHNTNYYLINIPYLDSNNEEIPFELIEAEQNTSPLDNSHIQNSNFTCNGSLAINNGTTFINGICIIDGIVVNDTDVSSWCTTEKYMGIKDNREIVIFDNDATSETMLQAGVKYACMIFGKCANNGVIDENFEFQTIKGPDIFIGQKANKDLMIIGCDGRNSNNKGMDYKEMSEILINNGCLDVYSLDGGGSTSMVYRGNKLNMNVDENGTKDRKITYLFNVSKRPTINNITAIYNLMGEMKHLLNYQLRPLINNCEVRHYATRLVLKNQFTPSSENNILPFRLSAPSSPQRITITDDGNGGTHINFPSGNGFVKIGFNLVIQANSDNAVYSYVYLNNSEIMNLGETATNGDVKTLSGSDYFYVNENTNDLTIRTNNGNVLRGWAYIEWLPINNTDYNSY